MATAWLVRQLCNESAAWLSALVWILAACGATGDLDAAVNHITLAAHPAEKILEIFEPGALSPEASDEEVEKAAQLREFTSVATASVATAMHPVTKAVATGAAHRLALLTNGSVLGSGANEYGQLGDGTTLQRERPVLVMNNVKSVAAGTHHSLFLLSDGSVYAAGWNVWGQLGDECLCDPALPECRTCFWQRPSESQPILVQNGVQAVAAGAAHSIFLKQDGSVLTAGWNNRGQLGDGTTTSRRHPVHVLADVQTIAAGSSHSLFLKRDGGAYSTGANSFGQLGDGTKLDRATPLLVRSAVANISAGVAQSIFLSTDGTVFATH